MKRIENGILEMFEEMKHMAKENPKFFQRFDDCDLTLGSSQEVKNLLAKAPSPEYKFFLLGVLTMRLQIEQISERVQ